MTAPADLGRDVDELTPGIIALRRALHQQPELAFEEVWTAATLAGQPPSRGFALAPSGASLPRQASHGGATGAHAPSAPGPLGGASPFMNCSR